jgi:hypothetical protein
MAAVLPPAAVSGPCFVLHRVVRAQPTWEELIGEGTLTPEAHGAIEHAVKARASILVAGGGRGAARPRSRISSPAASRRTSGSSSSSRRTTSSLSTRALSRWRQVPKPTCRSRTCCGRRCACNRSGS